jgi:hypothetical protein
MICYQFDNYTGIFKDLNNQIHDLRPHNDKNLLNWLDDKEHHQIIIKPCVNTFISW